MKICFCSSLVHGKLCCTLNANTWELKITFSNIYQQRIFLQRKKLFRCHDVVNCMFYEPMVSFTGTQISERTTVNVRCALVFLVGVVLGGTVWTFICTVSFSRGCFTALELEPKGNPFKCQQAKTKAHLEAILCCDKNRCNNDINVPTLAPPPPSPG